MSEHDEDRSGVSDPMLRSTPESRAAREAQRAKDYPLSDERLAPLRATLTERLRAAGVELPSPEFDALVLDMARFALRWSAEEEDRREEDRRVDERRQGERRKRT